MKIYLIEDDEFDAMHIANTIKHLLPSAKVISATTTEDARKLLERDMGREPDAVIVDHHLPGEDGAEFVRQLRKDRLAGSAMIVMLTSDASDRTRAEALASDFDAFLTKPVETRRLKDILTRRRPFWEKNDLPGNLDLYRDIRRAVSS